MKSRAVYADDELVTPGLETIPVPPVALDAPATQPSIAFTSPRQKPPSPFRLAVGMRGDLVRDLAPVSVWSVNLFGDFAFRTSRAWLVPRVGVSTGYMTTFQTVIGTQPIFIRWSTFALEGAGVSLRTGPLEVYPQLRVVGGYANASTPDFFGRFLYVRPFLTAGAMVRGRVALSRVFFVEATGGGDFDLVRSRFEREDGAELFTSGPLVWHASIGFGVFVIK